MAHEFYQGLLWLFFGIAVTYFSSKYSMGTLSEPGPGTLPSGLGLIFILLSVILLIRSWRFKGEAPLPFGKRYRKVFLIIVFIALDTLLLESLGYISAVFLQIIVPMFLIEPRRWPSILLLGVISSLASYVLFAHWLGIPLPRGVFYF